MGDVQLMAFANAASLEPVQQAAKELGFTRVETQAGTVALATEHLAQHKSPEILIVEIGDQNSAPAELDALADMVNPHTKVLATGKVDSIRFYQWLGELGIDGYLLQPFTAAEVKAAIAKGSIKKEQAAAAAATSAPKKIIAVIGARGGVGTTMIASNIAAIIAGEHKQATALVDLDPYFGCVALSLDLEPSRGLRDALEKPDRVDALFLERVMVKATPNLSILSAEEPLMDAIAMQPNAGEMIFAALKEKYSVMVVDLPRQMNPATRHVLNVADHVILVAEPQITSLRDALRLKDYVVETLKRPVPQLLLNRVGLNGGNELSAKEFSKNFGQDVRATLGYLPEVVAATAQGELLANTPKLQPVVKPLRMLVGGMLGASEAAKDEDEEAGPTSLITRILGKK